MSSELVCRELLNGDQIWVNSRYTGPVVIHTWQQSSNQGNFSENTGICPFKRIHIHGNFDKVKSEIVADTYSVGSRMHHSFYARISDCALIIFVRGVNHEPVDRINKKIGWIHLRKHADLFSDFMQEFADESGTLQVFLLGGKNFDRNIFASVKQTLDRLRVGFTDDLLDLIPSGSRATVRNDKSGNPVLVGIVPEGDDRSGENREQNKKVSDSGEKAHRVLQRSRSVENLR